MNKIKLELVGSSCFAIDHHKVLGKSCQSKVFHSNG